MIPGTVTSNPELKFQSLEDEQYRTYSFSNGNETTIVNPVALNVSKSGGHRVLDAAGVSHYVPAGWHHLRWLVKERQPNFAF